MTSDYPELAHWVAAGRRVVHESDTKALLARAGIAIPARNPDDGTCVVKLSSDRFPHKSEHGLVRLGVPAALAPQIIAELGAHDPTGVVLVEEMIQDGVAEWIVGCRHDPTFGPVIVLGPGGVLVELLDTTHVRLAPLDHATARRALIMHEPALSLLSGFRGRRCADITALVDLIVRLSNFFFEHADQIEEIEVNPVIVRPVGHGAVAADALMTLR